MRRTIPFLLIYFWLALHAAWVKSPTNDEPVHILRGYALLTRGDFQLQEDHPPLSHRVIGSLLRIEPSLPALESLPSWETNRDRNQIALELLWNDQTNLRRSIFLGRIPIIFTGLLFGAALIRASRGSPIVAALWALAPNWIAHSALATNDAMLTITFGLACMATVAYRNKPNVWRLLVAGLAIGLTMSTKASGSVILAVSGLLLVTTLRPSWAWVRTVASWLVMVALALVTIWAVLAFEVRSVSYFPLPLPAATYFDSLFNVGDHVSFGHQAYLLGEISRDGWWHYFVVAFLVKMPLGLLLLLALSGIVATQQRRWWILRDYWLPFAIFFAAASYARLNIGFRHLLPAIPFVWLFIADVLRPMYANRAAWRGPLWLASLLFVIGYAAESILAAPNYVSFFNVVARNSAETILGDSNFDWGQDFWALLDASDALEQPIHVKLAGFTDPNRYGLPTLDLDRDTGLVPDFSHANPAPGTYAISISNLQGTSLVQPDAFSWFRGQEPTNRVGRTIKIYNVAVDAVQQGDWIAHCAAPASPLSAEQAQQLLGQSAIRNVFFDCTQSWVYPAGDSGWYVLPSASAADWLPEQFDAGWQVVYAVGQTAYSAEYSIIHVSKRPAIRDIASAWPASVLDEQRRPLSEQISIGDAADLLGYQVNEASWTTVWEVVGLDSAETLSMFAHLYQDGPTPIEVADALGFPSAQWQIGDIVAQRHQFQTAGSCPTMATGLYNFLNGERLAAHSGTQLFLAACP